MKISKNKFDELARAIESAERKKDTGVTGVRNARKTAKEAGMPLRAFDFVRKNLQGFTEPEIVEFCNDIIMCAKYLSVPKVKDLDLFSVSDMTEEANLEHAREQGDVAGRMGISSDANPWPLDVPMGREWANAHMAAMEAQSGQAASQH